jgi:hypothetical protein
MINFDFALVGLSVSCCSAAQRLKGAFRDAGDMGVNVKAWRYRVGRNQRRRNSVEVVLKQGALGEELVDFWWP